MKITIIGCGWLGQPLAQRLKESGHIVYGSTTHVEKLEKLQDLKIIPFLFDSDHHRILPEVARGSELLILNFPPGSSGNYPEKVNEILIQLNNEVKVIFTSSTGVYEDLEGDVTEESPLKSDHPVALAEKMVRESGKEFAIVRLAGLIGGERHPVKHLTGRTLKDGNMVVNLIHREDVIAGIMKIIEKDHWNTIFNLVYPEHPAKSDYYSFSARKLGLTEPNFEFSVKRGKCVSGNKIEDELGFVYTHHI